LGLTVVFLLGASAGAVAGERSVRLDVGGEPTVLTMDYDLGPSVLRDEGVADVHITGRSIELKAMRAGSTVLEVKDSAGTVRDRVSILAAGGGEGVDVAAVRAFLSDDEGKPIPTLKVMELPGKAGVKVTGSVVLQRDLELIRKATEFFGDQLVDATEIDPKFVTGLAEQIRASINNANVKISSAGMEVFLSGMAYSPQERQQIEAMAKAVYPRVQNFMDVRVGTTNGIAGNVVLQKPLIQMECVLLEVRNVATKEIGIDWGGLIPVTASVSYDPASPFSSAGVVSVETAYLLKAMIPQVQNGNAKVHYRQNIVCEHGEQGKFFAGGSFFIVAYLAGTDDISTEEKEYGITIEVQPRTDKNGNVASSVNIEFSALGPTINNYPSLLKRYVATSVNVMKGQTLALAGMLGDDMRETVKKVPLLGDIPGLGQLFKSTDYQEGKSQVVILITPRVVIPGSAENQQMRDDIEKQMFAPDGTLQRKP
jgi:hypothetical protein